MSAYTTQIIPYVREVLNLIATAILSKSEWFEFPTESSDGRTNSQKGEYLVAEYLLNHPSLSGKLIKKISKKGKGTKKASEDSDDEDNRAFGDIGIDLTRFGWVESFPCNIKLISSKNKAGNNACGLTSLISYTFKRKCKNHEDGMSVLIDIHKQGYDCIEPLLYGLIMVVKDERKCWTGTFDEVPAKSIGTNPSNPLQVPFLTDRVSRTSREYVELLITKIVEYHKKKSQPLDMWNRYQSSKKE